MPRNVRNFWIEGTREDGKDVKGWGPIGSENGFTLTVLMREEGSISEKKVVLKGYSDGTTLTLRIATPGWHGNDIILQTVR